MTHSTVPFEDLVAYVLDELRPEAARLVEERLDASPPDAELLSRIRTTIQSLCAAAEDDSEPPTAEAIRRGLAAFEVPSNDYRKAIDAPIAALRRIIASLVFDNRAEPALAGFRGAGGAYQLGYESELARVGLRITQTPDPGRGWTIRGQIVPTVEASAERATLVKPDGATVASEVPDESGHFRLEAPDGTYDLVVDFTGHGCSLVMPAVELA